MSHRDRILKLRQTVSQIWKVVPVCSDRLALQMAGYALGEIEVVYCDRLDSNALAMIEEKLDELEGAIALLEKRYLR